MKERDNEALETTSVTNLCSLGTFSQQPNKTDCMETNTNVFKQKKQKQLEMQGKPRKNQIVRKQTTHIFKIQKNWKHF